MRYSRFLTSLLRLALPALLLATPFLRAAEDDAASKVVLVPAEGELNTESRFTVSFPDAMVAPELISAGDAPWPIVVEPKLEGRFLWQSTTEGQFRVTGKLVPGTHYIMSTTPGLKDVRGHAIPPQKWEFDSAAFTIATNDDDGDGGERKALSALPRFELTTNYPILTVDAAKHIFFQDRESHQRRPVEVLLRDEQSPERETNFTVLPREPLPVGRSWDLVVDGLCDAYGKKPLPFLQVIPAGPTSPLKLQWVGAFNPAMEKPIIRAKFSEHVDPESVTAERFNVTPAVPNLKVHAEADEVIAEGDFGPNQRYTVEIATSIHGLRGYGLEKGARWGATFRPKPGTIVFPGGDVYQRTSRGLHFSFAQVNCGPVKWTLSPVPVDRLPEISERVLGEYKKAEPPFAFTPVGHGEFPANDATHEEIVREIAWQPEQPLSGPYVLEVSSTDAAGQTIGNRALISFSEYVLTQKRAEKSLILRVAGMRDARPAAGLKVKAISPNGVELGAAETDADGLARFSTSAVLPENREGAKWFVVTTPGGPAVQEVDTPKLTYADGSTSPRESGWRGVVITDRNLYRPGQTVKLHALLRRMENGKLTLPGTGSTAWQIKPSSGGIPVATGEATLNAHGSWDAEWAIPTGVEIGDYEIAALSGGKPVASTVVQIEEFRTPLFSVELTPVEQPGATAQVKVLSNYFHGAPNANAKVRWTAVWSAMETAEDDNFVRGDQHSEHHAEHFFDEAEAKGEAVLDAKGQVTLACEPPYPDGLPRGRSRVSWLVEITSPEAQTQSANAVGKAQPGNVWLGLRTEAKPGKNPVIKVETSALDWQDEPVANASATIDLFHVRARTVKERIAPFITRYRNVREYEKVGSKLAPHPGSFDFPVKETGEYVAVISGAGGTMASDNLTLSGDQPAEMPVANETEIYVTPPQPVRAYRPGETVPLAVRAPFAGTAWVSVEAGEVLDTLLVPMAGNAGRIDLPMKKEYAPNVTVTVYLLQPGGEKNLPRERAGKVRLAVEEPEKALSVETKLASANVKPGQPVRGELIVQSEGRPVAGAEFLVFAVDEAVLKLGDWRMPELAKAFYPERSHLVSTHAALTKFVESIKRESLHQKGYVVGGGGEGMGNVTLRKEFKTLAYWQPGLFTDAKGKVTFEFPAPENLTEYRLVAIGQSDLNQFGGGSTKFQVSKPLLCEPSLPRFTRIGDELELRAVVRQSVVAKGRITARCTTEGVELQETQPQTKEAAQGLPVVFNFKAKVGENSSTAAKVRFECSSDFGEADAVEISLPILPPTVLRHEALAFTSAGASFNPAESAPKAWSEGRGTLNVTLSTSEWLPKLGGLPSVLEYPHGCFEQISSRILAYAMLPDLLSYLPDASAREAHYRETLQRALQTYEPALQPDGMLPYWPDRETSEPCVTVLAAWAISEAGKVGLNVPEKLRTTLAATLEKIIAGKVEVPAFTRCLAVMIAEPADEATKQKYAATVQDLYLRREKFGAEERALLALAMHEMKIMKKEQGQLLKELARPPVPRAFDPETFSSTARAEALTTLALARLDPTNAALKPRRDAMLKSMEQSAGLSTQENLWQLMAFKAVVQMKPAAPLKVTAGAEPAPTALSKNGSAVLWGNRDLARLAALRLTGLPSGTPLTGLLSAEYRVTKPEELRTDRGLRVERVTRNLTDAKRTGEAGAPFKLGDQILVTYRLLSRNEHFYVALEDLLPAGLETVNPNLPLIAKTYPMLATMGQGRSLDLSHSELRDQSTCLYFNRVEPGTGEYSVLARATTAGKFRWPATQAYPMYDARFTGMSAAGELVVGE